VLATDIPEHVSVNVQDLQDGVQIHAAQLELPEGAELETDPEALVVAIVTPRGTADDDAADAASAEAGAESGADGAAE
jgi:large subunit ribosomal protein L25